MFKGRNVGAFESIYVVRHPKMRHSDRIEKWSLSIDNIFNIDAVLVILGKISALEFVHINFSSKFKSKA